MVLTKDQLIAALQEEVRILLHLISKVDPAVLDYRPTPRQRSMIELLQYLTIMGPIHAGVIKTGVFDMASWRNTWREQEAIAGARNLEEVEDAISKQSALFAELLGSCSDVEFRAEFEMFGSKASRGLWFVKLVLCHFPAYRMQLFLYLKSCGREELSTVNLWAGTDAM
jgi:hypothetical protein